MVYISLQNSSIKKSIPVLFHIIIQLNLVLSFSSCLQDKEKQKKYNSQSELKIDNYLNYSNSAINNEIFLDTNYNFISVCSWNLKDFGKEKSDSEIDFITNTVKVFDILVIQEVVAKDPGGAQAVARLADALNRTGSKWDYSISDKTSGKSYKSERYAFIWKTSKVLKFGDSWLEKKYSFEIDREPYFIKFKFNGKFFTLVNFHAITKDKHPETEIAYLNFLPDEYHGLNLIFTGDFNCPESDTTFYPLKSMDYKPVFTNQKTTLKKECNNEGCLKSEFDNIFYSQAKINIENSGVVHFYKAFATLTEAEKISDHIPVYFQFSFK